MQSRQKFPHVTMEQSPITVRIHAKFTMHK